MIMNFAVLIEHQLMTIGQTAYTAVACHAVKICSDIHVLGTVLGKLLFKSNLLQLQVTC